MNDNIKCMIHFVLFPLVPLLSGIHASKLDVTLLDKFGVTFGTEGESLSLKCTMSVVPDLPNLPPEAMWYRDGEITAVPFCIFY